MCGQVVSGICGKHLKSFSLHVLGEMGALQELLQAGSSAAERTGGHGKEQFSVCSFWVVEFVCWFGLVFPLVFLF